MHAFAGVHGVQLGHNIGDVMLVAMLVSEYAVTTSGSAAIQCAAKIPQLPISCKSQFDSASPSVTSIRDYLFWFRVEPNSPHLMASKMLDLPLPFLPKRKT
jgi:hypothetical protein